MNVSILNVSISFNNTTLLKPFAIRTRRPAFPTSFESALELQETRRPPPELPFNEGLSAIMD